MMPHKNLLERRKYRREWYAKNKDREKKHVKKRKDEIRMWFSKLKSSLKCTQCGGNHPATLDFHHLNSDKENNVALMAYYGYSIKKIKKEMDKCVVVCANCHRKIHHQKTKNV